MKKLILSALALATILTPQTSQAANSLSLSHKVFGGEGLEITKIAKSENFSYKLYIQNTSTTASSKETLEFDLSGVLPLADIVDTGGGVLSGQILKFEIGSLAPQASTEKVVKLKTKNALPNYQYIIQTHFGNTLNLSIEPDGGAAHKATPKTGGLDTLPLVFGFSGMGIYFVIKKLKFV